MKQAIEKVEMETAQQRNTNSVLQQHLEGLRETLTHGFCNLPLPGTNEVPTGETIDSYMTKLYSVILDSPQENEGLISSVREIVSRLGYQKLVRQQYYICARFIDFVSLRNCSCLLLA